jgi:hypothetical protein
VARTRMPRGMAHRAIRVHRCALGLARRRFSVLIVSSKKCKK